MIYCLDTSALISLGERYYPEHVSVFKPIWNHIYKSIDDGEIISVDYVKKELEEKADDWRKKFITKADSMFHISESIEAEYASIILEIEIGSQFLDNIHRKRFMKGADPWLIALAKSLPDCTIVSGETKKLADYGLGVVCQELGVKHVGLVKFFEVIK
jgi:Domain of unknown function (DUF4411)